MSKVYVIFFYKNRIKKYVCSKALAFIYYCNVLVRNVTII